jgi:hypothetical protein
MAKKKVKREPLGGDAMKAMLLKNNTFNKYRRIVRAIKEKIDLEELEAEMRRLYSGRQSRALFGTHPGPEKLMNASLQDASFRTRMVEIRLELSKQADILDIAIDAVRSYLRKEYEDDMPDIKTKGERVTYFDQYLRRGLELKASMDSLIKRLDHAIKDIDQMGFTFKHLSEMLALIYSKNTKNM